MPQQPSQLTPNQPYWLLSGIHLPHQNQTVAICISEGKIKNIYPDESLDPKFIAHAQYHIRIKNGWLWPGNINAHEHLAFNAYPTLTNQKFADYTQWADFLHQTCRQQIAKIEALPITLRLQCTMVKNILAGVTTICQHGRNYAKLLPAPPINVYYCRTLHSLAHEKKYRFWQFWLPKPHRLPTIHLAEGSSFLAAAEPNELQKIIPRYCKFIAIHGITLTANHPILKQLKGLVWCPYSNLELYGATAPLQTLTSQLPIAFGTDSTLSSHWDWWQHIQTATQTQLLSPETLYQAATKTGASIFNLPDYNNAGIITNDTKADFFVTTYPELISATNPDDLANNTASQWALTQTKNIQLVVCKGQIVQIDDNIAAAHNLPVENGFTSLNIQGCKKWLSGNYKNTIAYIRNNLNWGIN
ncbi:MAG: amidohydrolase family protein [Sphingobacteriales bacterium]|jgi:cytosine/adenosine deaminase-related metal-dependent hydrolase|nr:amidohydrolase family protein [Sphingobacteriales bacterium]MBP9142684.1 amidohydrolase family protein [Chitinophagales bacterium]MDA0199784.1 amidohydrolase family protein [Bacteroidota bacterium]MBK6888765.1 amidohydrolase family protein [Sphingobacteriales bacterium]MBK7528728.1 amidohydrolase family protein [Sphingobacteriales bacterium]